MIVKSAIYFLSIVDFFWDTYERVSGWLTQTNEKRVIATETKKPVKASFSVQ